MLFCSCICYEGVTIFIDWNPVLLHNSFPESTSLLFAAAVHAAVETVSGGEAGQRHSGCDPSQELRTSTVCIFSSCPSGYNKRAQHRRLLPRFGLPVDLQSAGGTGGQLPEQWDNGLFEDGASFEPSSERRRGQRRLQPAGEVPVVGTAEGRGRGGRGQRQNRDTSTFLTRIAQPVNTNQLSCTEATTSDQMSRVHLRLPVLLTILLTICGNY